MLRQFSKRFQDGKVKLDFRTGTSGLNLLNSNFWGDGSDETLTVSADTSLSSTQDGDIVVKQLSSLSIDAGKTLTLTTRCKGMALYIAGDCVINGKLSMSARGAYVDPAAAGVSSTGIRIIRKKSGSTDTLAASDVAGCGAALIAAEGQQSALSGDGKIYTIARAGGAGAAAVTTDTTAGNTGSPGSTGQSGGGGSGARRTGGNSGAGAAGTCFSGGSGGGGAGYGAATGGTANGGAGGGGAGGAGNAGGGGAGNPGGAGASSGSNTGYSGTDGTGGLLMLFVRGNLTIGSGGSIEAKGSAGGGTTGSSCAGGAGSGGGNILILYGGTLTNNGSISCAGGAGGTSTHNGGSGGAGSYVIEQVAI